MATKVKKGFKSAQEVARHIRESDSKNNPEHDALKVADGWYELGWAVHQSENRFKRKKDHSDRDLRRLLKRVGIEYAELAELDEGIPHATLQGVIKGGQVDQKLPKRFEDLIGEEDFDLGPKSTRQRSRGDHTQFKQGIPRQVQQYVVGGDQEDGSLNGIPQYLDSLICYDEDFNPLL